MSVLTLLRTSKVELHDLIHRLKNKPSRITATEKLLLAQLLEQLLENEEQ